MKLNVLVSGQGYPVLCLHGHPGSGRSMDVFTAHLSQQWSTLAPDLRGYGQSRTAIAFEMADHLSDLKQVLDSHHISHCVVLGWSLGGILALELALSYPERVSGLILVATAARPRGSHPAVTWQDNVYTGVASLINRAVPGWQWNIDAFGKRSLYRYLLQQHSPEAYRRLAFEGLSAYVQTSRQANQALHQALRYGYDRLPDLPQIQVPCLMLCAERDRHITAAASIETAQHLPHCQLQTYPNTAHLFPWEIPAQVLDDCDRWLNTHMGSS